MKNYGDLGGCYPPRPTASRDNILLDFHNSFLRYSASFINCLLFNPFVLAFFLVGAGDTFWAVA